MLTTAGRDVTTALGSAARGRRRHDYGSRQVGRGLEDDLKPITTATLSSDARWVSGYA